MRRQERSSMDSIFLLNDAKRDAFLQSLIRSFGFTHVYLWSYSPFPSNCLMCLDGLCQERITPSSGTFAATLSDAYRNSVTYLDVEGRLPGFAFKNCLPYIQMELESLLRMASSEVQIQFYQEAGIKTVAFIGCTAGEVELGMSSSEPPSNLKMEMEKWFHHYIDHTLNSTSSSPIKSLSLESSDYSPSLSLFDIPTSTFTDEALLEEALLQESIPTAPAAADYDSSHARDGAFIRYRQRPSPPRNCPRKQNTFKKAVLFYRDLTSATARAHGKWPSTTQLHHMISERRRREKLNEGFQVLRALLPPGSKKDKASILSTTTDLLAALKSQVEELTKRNQQLESRLSPQSEAAAGSEQVSSNGGVEVEITHAPAAPEPARLLDLRVGLRSGQCRMLELVNKVLGVVRQRRDAHAITLLSLQSNTEMVDANPTHCLRLRLKVEGQNFDDRGFQEAVKKRIVDADLLLH